MFSYRIKAAFIILTAFLTFTSCDSDDSSTNPDDGTTQDGTFNYSGAASYGDLVTFSIDTSASTYSVTNETTGFTDNGTYNTVTGTLQRVYQVIADGQFFYAVELTNEILVANFPVGTGSSRTDLSFGVSSMYDNTSRTQYIAGDYVWITLSENSVNGSVLNKEWGVLTVNSDGSWNKINFATGGTGSTTIMSPYDFSGSFPVSSAVADETGTWSVNGTKKERLDVTVDGVSGTLTGFSYASLNGSAFLLDLGQGEGFMLGLQRPVTAKSLTDITGSYKFVDIWGNDDTGAGNYSITASANGTYYHKSIDGTTATGTFTNIVQCPVLWNVWRADMDITNTELYMVVTGNIIMHFMFEDGDFVSYGAGAKLN